MIDTVEPNLRLRVEDTRDNIDNTLVDAPKIFSATFSEMKIRSEACLQDSMTILFSAHLSLDDQEAHGGEIAELEAVSAEVFSMTCLAE